MRRQLHNQTRIEAPAAAVWAVLIDLQAYGHWNPVVTAAQGDVTPGCRLALTLRLPGHGPKAVSASLLRVVSCREVSCVVRTGPAGLLDVLYEVRMDPSESLEVELLQSVTVSGILMPFFWLRRRDSLRRALADFGAALKERVRQQPGESTSFALPYSD